MTIDEIFDSMAEEAADAGYEYLVIDPDTRKITVPESERIFGVVSDEVAVRKYFLAPRYVGDGLDLAGMFLTVYFRNAKGVEDGYLVDDVQVVTGASEYVTFSWLLWPKVTQYNGKVQFAVCADLPNTATLRRPDWNTTLAEGEVLEGLDPELDDLEDGSSDVLTQLREMVTAQTAAVEATGAAQVDVVEAAGAAATADAQAQIEAKGAATLATIPEDYTTLANKSNEHANAIKGNLFGQIVRADDVSPVEHYPVVWVHGKNLAKFDNAANPNRGDYSYTQETAEGVVCNKTTTTGGSFFARFEAYLEAYTMYTISVVSNMVKPSYFVYSDELWGTQCWSAEMENCVASFYVKQTGRHVIGFYASGAWEAALTLSNVQIEKGTVATEYAAYIDPTTVLLSRYGKNLLNLGNCSRANCIISGTGIQANVADVYYCELYANYLKAAVQASDGKALTFSVGNLADGAFIAIVIMYTDGTYAQKTAYEKTATLWLDHQGRAVQHVIVRPLCKKEAFTDTTTVVRDLMLEFTETASTFEEYTGQGYTPLEDGSVGGLTSVAPTMVVLTDTAGVIVECEYNRDSNAVYAELLAKIAALSGTT